LEFKTSSNLKNIQNILKIREEIYLMNKTRIDREEIIGKARERATERADADDINENCQCPEGGGAGCKDGCCGWHGKR
jgi:hypothetical protein